MTQPVIRESRAVIDLSAIAANYGRIRYVSASTAAGSPPEVAAMVKSDAYGLGAARVAPRLVAEGCDVFFVAHLSEGVALREVLGEAPRILVLNGALPGTVRELRQHNLVPVLNSLDQVERWVGRAEIEESPLPAAVHIDTGMHRLGLTGKEWDRFVADDRLRSGLELWWLCSHLASADEAEPIVAEEQRRRFVECCEGFPQPDVGRSLANSAGVFLGPAYHFDLVRPGIALYGGSPRTGVEMEPVVTVEAPIVQVFDVGAGDRVGYGGTHTMAASGRLATVAVGYGDGFLRAGSGVGSMVVGEWSVPIVGRISMDLTTVDVSGVPPGELWPGRAVEVLGARRRLDNVAVAAGTIGYEVLTDLGRRYERSYLGDIDQV